MERKSRPGGGTIPVAGNGINRETVALVANGKTVKAVTLRQMVAFLAKGAK